ncbi:MAG: hypothetical protein LBI28_08410 [Treponema sp.]|jgi:hypothetical protein|nr:hypothetical protein [Treponema sp.]
MNPDKIHLEYKESLTEDYTKNYFEIIYDKNNGAFEYIYLYNSRYGTLEYKDGKKEIHKWETEDEAQDGSYLNKNYPIICLDGVTDDRLLENNIIEANMEYIKTLELQEEETEIINSGIEFLKK